MSLAVITINNLSPALDKKFQEVQIVARGLALAAQAISGAGGQVTSGNILNDGATVIGTWVYTPQAGS
ncbi:MAG: hypothetical protein E8A46_02620 [Bradyrhizobium sp.]|uniref:hypothetical protein n=1 Tax=Bradyrhizobium sp. TaxID=376 RepID=UPI00120BC611|nr:hypothetical protein [Bradyrhizobium sp.]THD56756.1 MAG: hypothetical protein E8A46_02620 [Bradyrhizobium sp.]